jgi:EAL and modified HD-GYP domain-containing signal transduction protein
MARQAIVDKQRRRVGYELLFRGGLDNIAHVDDGDSATSRVLVGSMTGVSLEKLTDGAPAFINFTRNLLVGLDAELLPLSTVIEVLEDVRIDDELLACLERFRERGLRLALDDFLLNSKSERVVPLANYVKIDVLNTPASEVAGMVQRLSGKGCQLVAEKVEDYDMFERCREQGFDFFQGFFLHRPEMVKGVVNRPGTTAVLRLLNALNDPEVEFQSLENIIASDPSLGYKLLRIVSSAGVAGRTINSLRQALQLLGLKALKSWGIVLVMAGLEDKPRELLRGLLVRARTCQQLAWMTGESDADAWFTVGLFSGLDALLDASLEDLVQSLRLEPHLREALLFGRGPAGEALTRVIAHEHGEWADGQESRISAEHLSQAYADALAWADKTLAQVYG